MLPSLNCPSVGIFSVHGWFVFAKKRQKTKCNDCKTETKHREKLMKTRPRPYLTWPSFPLTHAHWNHHYSATQTISLIIFIFLPKFALFFSKASHTACLPDQTVTAVMRRPPAVPPVFHPSCWDAGSSALLTVPAGYIQAAQQAMRPDQGWRPSNLQLPQIHTMCLHRHILCHYYAIKRKKSDIYYTPVWINMASWEFSLFGLQFFIFSYLSL